MSVTLNLHDFLQAHGITAYRLEKELEGRLNRNSIYALAKSGSVRRIDLDSLDKVLGVLSAILGRSVGLDELFDVQPNPHELRKSASGFQYTGDSATDDTLDAYTDLEERLAAAEKV